MGIGIDVATFVQRNAFLSAEGGSGASGATTFWPRSSGNNISENIYFNGKRIARRDASGTVYYFITDHIGNVRVVANASGGVVEESDYLPFGTENVIASTLDNNYKFIGMERDLRGHGGIRPLAVPQVRTQPGPLDPSPDQVHGSPANPQLWNRYPNVLNDLLTLIDPLGATPTAYDSYFVMCIPDPFFESLFDGFGCSYADDSPCPPGGLREAIPCKARFCPGPRWSSLQEKYFSARRSRFSPPLLMPARELGLRPSSLPAERIWWNASLRAVQAGFLIIFPSGVFTSGVLMESL